MREIKKILAFTLAFTMLLSSASCALFGKNKEVLEAADKFASALVSMNTRKILKLTTEKKDSDAAYTLSYILDNERRSDEMNKFVKAVSSTITYEVDSDSLEADDEKASVDVIFTMVDYEKVLKNDDFESIDDLLSAIEDCDDTEDVKITLKFKNKKDEWLVSNIKDKDYAELYEFCSCSLGLKPDIEQLFDYTYISAGTNYINLYVYFDDDISLYENLFTYDVFYGNTCLKSDAQAQIYGDFLLCDYYDPAYSDLGPGLYTVNVYYDGEDVTSESVEIAGLTSNDDDFDYAGYKDFVVTSTLGYGDEQLNLWVFSGDVSSYVESFMELNPDFASRYTVNITTLSTTEGYFEALDKALDEGVSSGPDIFIADADHAYKYVEGSMSGFTATYDEIGINGVLGKIEDAEIAPYVVELGSRNGDVVALSYDSTAGALIYRRSIANDLFGTDDPSEIEAILGGGTGDWDKFKEAAEVCADNGVSIISGAYDLYRPFANSKSPWIINGTMNIDSGRREFFDFYKLFVDNGWSNDNAQWYDGWRADYAGTGETPVFCFFGPYWFINYVMANDAENTYGDWAICLPPCGFYWGGTYIFANKYTDCEDGVAELIEWLTLDTSSTGLQYMLANGQLNNSDILTVASNAIMADTNSSMDYLDGQDVFPVFIEANLLATGYNASEYDSDIDSCLMDAVHEYVTESGECYNDLAGALVFFEQRVYDIVGI